MSISVKTYSNGEVLTANDLNAHLATMVDEINRLAALHTGNQASRNLLINGDFSVWQRGTTGASGYVTDRWNFLSGFTTGSRATASAEVPTSRYGLLIERNVAGVEALYQRIEANNAVVMSDKTTTFSIKPVLISGTVDAIRVKIYRATTYDDFSSLTLLDTIEITNPVMVGEVLDFTSITLPIECEYGVQVTLEVDSPNAGGSIVNLHEAQFEVGGVSTEFERVSASDQLARCKRYFERINYDTTGSTVAMAHAETTTTAVAGLYYTEKRGTPTVAEGGTGTISGVTAAGGNAGGTVAFDKINMTNCKLNLSGAAALAAGNASRLYATTDMHIDIDAEL